jgi:thiamine kinase-like enzyme
LVDYETGYHKEYFYDFKNSKEIMEVLQNLKNGLPCIIMEDMNPGNLFITNDKRYKFIDTEWIIRGINLYQFEKIDYFGFEEKAWYTITDEAKECYTAYFDELGIKSDEANEQIRAFELLQVLRKNTYLKFCEGQNGPGQNDPGKNDKEIERRVAEVMEKEKFI